MRPHGVARGLLVASRDRTADRAVLALDLAEIGGLLVAADLFDPHALARDDVVAEIAEEALEIGIAGRRRDHAMELEIGLDRRLAAVDRGIDLGELGLDPRDVLGGAPARRQAR